MTNPSPMDAFLSEINRNHGKIPKTLHQKVHDIATKAAEEMVQQAGKFLHQELDQDIHTESEIKALIDLFPEALSCHDEDGYLPVQSAIVDKGDGRTPPINFVPLLAREGEKRNVGGSNQRGGLLLELDGDDDYNTLQYLTWPPYNNDLKYTKVLAKLHEMNLLQRGDVKKFQLLANALTEPAVAIFNFLVDLDPDPNTLGTAWRDGLAIIHQSYRYESDSDNYKVPSMTRFEILLNAGMRHFPQWLGFLFRKHGRLDQLDHGQEHVHEDEHEQDDDDSPKTACEVAFDSFGADEAMAIIKRCIPPSANHPILHRAFQHAPKLANQIGGYYPDATYLRDGTDRTPFEIKFHSDLMDVNVVPTRTYKEDALFFLQATDGQISARDPTTGLYPFMMVASLENESDLSAIYCLLRRNPKLVLPEGDGRTNISATGSIGGPRTRSINTRMMASRKRQRDNINAMEE